MSTFNSVTEGANVSAGPQRGLRREIAVISRKIDQYSSAVITCLSVGRRQLLVVFLWGGRNMRAVLVAEKLGVTESCRFYEVLAPYLQKVSSKTCK